MQLEDIQSIQLEARYPNKFRKSKYKKAICVKCGNAKVLITRSKRKQKPGDAYWRLFYSLNSVGPVALNCQHDWRGIDG